ncbi:MAG: GNAT family N-acetyltransferase [Candidatus Bathyarchaeota archaeon]
MKVTIRKARKEDIQVLEELFLEFSSWNLDRQKSLHKVIDDPNGILLVAEYNDQVVGFIHQVFFMDPLHAGHNSDITNLFVKEKFRRKGIASSLVQKALEDAKRRKVVEIHVTTRKNNLKAINFYQELGFKMEGLLFEKNP